MAEHTPGPWKINETSQSFEILTQNGDLIALLEKYDTITGKPLPSPKYNAMLMKSAPEMLVALEQLRDRDLVIVNGIAICDYCGQKAKDPEKIQHLYCPYCIITKAKGEQ